MVLAGIPVFVAAGNEDQDACNTSPARDPLAFTVAATDRQDRRLWVEQGVASNYGPCVKLYAPGNEILGADCASDSATLYVTIVLGVDCTFTVHVTVLIPQSLLA